MILCKSIHCAFERWIIPALPIWLQSSYVNEIPNETSLKLMKDIFVRYLHPLLPNKFWNSHNCWRLSHLAEERVAIPTGEILFQPVLSLSLRKFNSSILRVSWIQIYLTSSSPMLHLYILHNIYQDRVVVLLWSQAYYYSS